jgi:hypothetical protein
LMVLAHAWPMAAQSGNSYSVRPFCP